MHIATSDNFYVLIHYILRRVNNIRKQHEILIISTVVKLHAINIYIYI